MARAAAGKQTCRRTIVAASAAATKVQGVLRGETCAPTAALPASPERRHREHRPNNSPKIAPNALAMSPTGVAPNSDDDSQGIGQA